MSIADHPADGSARILILAGGLCGAAGVALSAAAAHLGGAFVGTAASFLLMHAPVFLAVGLASANRILRIGSLVLLVGLVLFCGDLLWRTHPNIVDGAVSKWIATDRSFEDLPEAASMVFVPGHGDVATVKDVAMFRSYLADFMSLTEAGRKNGLKGAALAADVVPKLHASHPDYPTITLAGVALMERELDGTKRVPQPVP